jgi:4-hydroxybenzoyl-CoA reductase subunit beta
MNTHRLPRLQYFEPESIDEVFELRKKFGHESVILAGGTDVIPLLKRRNISTRCLINIKGISRLHKISYEEKEGLRVGAAVGLREVTENPKILDSYSLLARAAVSVAYNQIRNMGTIGGNICVDNKCTFFNQSSFWWQSRQDCFKRGGDKCYAVKGGKKCYALSVGDTVSALVALDAELTIASPEGERRTPVQEFYTGDGRKPHHLGDNELVTAVLIPPPSQGWREGFLKKGVRDSVDFAIASLSMRLKNNGPGIEDIRIALNGVSSKPIRAKKTERYLIVNSLNDDTVREAVDILLKETTPLSSIGTSAFVRRRMIQAMFCELIQMNRA